MDTARYRAFLTAAETGSIREAAALLDYTPSGVSQLIHALESELRLVLFHRGKKGVRLTAAGELLLPAARAAAAGEDQLLQLAADLHGAVRGSVNVACYHSLATAWMPTVLKEYQRRFPEVRVNLFESTQQEIMERLRDGRADLAFFNDSAMTGPYDWTPLMEDPMLAVVPATHPLAAAEEFPVPAFAGERFIMPENGFDFDVQTILRKYGIQPRVVLSVTDSGVLLELAAAGLGLSILNGACLRGRELPEGLRALPLSPAGAIRMGMAAMDLKTASPAVRRFAAVARDTIRGLLTSA